MLENLRIMGQVTGQPEAAAAAITRFDNVLVNLKALATPETQGQTVAVLWDDGVPGFVGIGDDKRNLPPEQCETENGA